MDFGFKVSALGDEVSEASLQKLIVNSSHPLWKCDLRPTPKHFGLIRGTVTGIKTLYSFDHQYNYIPSFLVAWLYPPGDTSGATYGIGSLETSSGTVLATMNDEKFTIESVGFSSSFYMEMRFYIFADDFPLYTYLPISL